MVTQKFLSEVVEGSWFLPRPDDRGNRSVVEPQRGSAAVDMAGNAVEWVSDLYDPAYYSVSPVQDPTGPVPATRKAALRSERVHRGSAENGWDEGQNRTTARGSEMPHDVMDGHYGFRCAADAPPPQ